MVKDLPKTFHLALDRSIGNRDPGKFVPAVNRRLKGIHPPLDQEQLAVMRTDPKANSYGMPLVDAIAATLNTGKQRIGDEHAAQLTQAGERALAAHRQRLVKAWRQTNPPGLEDQPSIHEMIEETWEEKSTLKDLFDKVSENWAFRGRPFGTFRMTNLLKRRQRKIGEKPPGQDSLATFYNREAPINRRMVMTAKKLMKAFDVIGEQRLMFQRIASASCDEFSLSVIEKMADGVIADPDNQEKRKRLLRDLHSASGLSEGLVADLTQQSKKDLQGELTARYKIRRASRALALAEVYLPDFLFDSYPKIMKLRRKVAAALTGKPLHKDLPAILKETEAASDPTKYLYSRLIGNQSFKDISLQDAVKHLGETERFIRSRIKAEVETEKAFAEKVADMVEATPAQKKKIVALLMPQTLTPTQLMQEVKDGKLLFLAAATKMRLATGKTLTQTACKGLGRNTLTKIETHGEKVDPRTAKIHADLFFPEDERGQEYEWHMSCATGYEPLSKDEVIEKLKIGDMDTETAICQLLAITGIAHRRTGIRNKSFPRIYGGYATSEQITKLARAIGCDETDLGILRRNRGEKRHRHKKFIKKKPTQDKYGYHIYPPSVD